MTRTLGAVVLLLLLVGATRVRPVPPENVGLYLTDADLPGPPADLPEASPSVPVKLGPGGRVLGDRPLEWSGSREPGSPQPLHPETAGPPSQPAVAPSPTAAGEVPRAEPLPPGDALLAVPRQDSVIAFDRPDGSPLWSFPARNRLGQPRWFLIRSVSDDGRWLEVYLPTRPNGSTGWVSAESAEMRRTDRAVVVDLSNRRLTLFRSGRPVFDASVTIGRADTPTPTGVAYVTEVVENPEPEGGYGAFVIGLSTHSEALATYDAGDAQIGIHGTNRPERIGEAVSHGCIRLTNDQVAVLAHEVTLGTPVLVL